MTHVCVCTYRIGDSCSGAGCVHRGHSRESEAGRAGGEQVRARCVPQEEYRFFRGVHRARARRDAPRQLHLPVRTGEYAPLARERGERPSFLSLPPPLRPPPSPSRSQEIPVEEKWRGPPAPHPVSPIPGTVSVAFITATRNTCEFVCSHRVARKCTRTARGRGKGEGRGEEAGHLGAAGAFDPFLFSKLLSSEVTLLPLLAPFGSREPPQETRVSRVGITLLTDTPGDISR